LPWIKFDDHFDEHPKIAALSDSAFSLWVTSIAYSNRNLTDGFIPSMVGLGKLRFCDGNTIQPIRELEAAGLWESCEGGWRIHDYSDFQPSKAQVLAERENNRIRQGRFRGRNAVTNAVDNGPVTGAPVPVPVPKKERSSSLSPSSRLDPSMSLSPSGHASGATGVVDQDEITAVQAFDEVFWPEYPRKVAKRRALKAWKALKLKDTDEETLERIMAKLSWCKQMEWMNRDQDKIPHPATWINDRRWED
jgi:hypothetical protein